jgi:hypothetical protein
LSIAKGLCQCGCGQPTNIVKASCASRGLRRGDHYQFVRGHHNRTTTRYLEADCGYETPCWIWQLHKSRDGHGRVVLQGGRFVMAHRAMYEERHGAISEGMHLHHRCEVPGCVNPDHLEELTPAQHKQRHARLTESDVRAIRARHAAGGITYQALADEFGVSLTMAWQIVKRQTWKNVA